MKKVLAKGFYFITDHALSRKGNICDVKDACAAYVSAVQYRRKEGEPALLMDEARMLASFCVEVPFIINDFLDIALAVNADGLHLGRGDIAYVQARKALGYKKIIGLSVHSLRQAMEAEELGADYLGLGPIFATSTKKDAQAPCGVGLIREIKKVCRLPLVAIGGINLLNASEVIDAGADCVCAISATVSASDVKKEIDKYNKLFKMNA